MFPAGEEVIARTTVRWDKGLFTAVLKAPCVPPVLQVFTWIVFSCEQCTRSQYGARAGS
jgi:hypothetical protein